MIRASMESTRKMCTFQSMLSEAMIRGFRHLVKCVRLGYKIEIGAIS